MISGVLFVFVCTHVLNNIIDSKGNTNGIYDIGSAIWYSLVASHHALFLIQTRSFNWIMIIVYIISALMFPLVVWMANTGGDHQLGSQWLYVFNTPLLNLTVFFVTFVSILPRLIWIICEHIVAWPEFAKVKSS